MGDGARVVGDGAGVGAKMKAVEEVVLYQGRGLYYVLEDCLMEIYRVERERRGATDTNVTGTVGALKSKCRITSLPAKVRDS